ncbi:hypothetical protein GCM10020295_62680 [Streptomyces cinereospinus]
MTSRTRRSGRAPTAGVPPAVRPAGVGARRRERLRRGLRPPHPARRLPGRGRSAGRPRRAGRQWSGLAAVPRRQRGPGGGLAPPPQSVHPDVRDLDGLAATCARGRALGFLGRAAIHPRQLAVIERAYLPSPEEIEKAEAVVKAAATNRSAQALPDGTFIDAAVVVEAARTLTLAHRR